MKAMSDAVGPGDLVLCVNAAPNHVTGMPVPLQAGETYRVSAVYENSTKAPIDAMAGLFLFYSRQ